MKNLLNFEDFINESILNEKNINPSQVIGIAKEVNGLLVAENDFDDTTSWKTAIKYCSSLGDGWRLPYIEELSYMWENQESIGGFNTNDPSLYLCINKMTEFPFYVVFSKPEQDKFHYGSKPFALMRHQQTMKIFRVRAVKGEFKK